MYVLKQSLQPATTPYIVKAVTPFYRVSFQLKNTFPTLSSLFVTYKHSFASSDQRRFNRN